MKNTKKILIFTAMLTLLFSLFSVFACAAEETLKVESNIFETVYSEIIKHSDKILSALAFCASLILAFMYRKGLLPMVRSALNKISSAVSALSEKNEESAALFKASEARLAETESYLTALTEKLGELEASLKESERRAGECDLKTLMLTQIDMLYELFMSSSIPLYQKEAVGSHIASMKKAIGASVTDDEKCGL